MPLNLQNSLEDKYVVQPLFSFEFWSFSSYWSTALPDFNRTLLKSRKWSPATFQKSSVLIREMYQPIGWQKFHYAVFKRVLQIQKHLVLAAKNFLIEQNIKGSWKNIEQLADHLIN
jgi:hypothetical protein